MNSNNLLLNYINDAVSILALPINRIFPSSMNVFGIKPRKYQKLLRKLNLLNVAEDYYYLESFLQKEIQINIKTALSVL